MVQLNQDSVDGCWLLAGIFDLLVADRSSGLRVVEQAALLPTGPRMP